MDVPPSLRLAEFRWPAEWEPQVATWAAWPVNPATWPGIFERIPPAFSRFVAAVTRFQPVRLLAGGNADREQIRRLTGEACEAVGGRFPVELFDVPFNDSWCRDYGPVFLTGRTGTPSAGRSLIVDWDYNAWGGKYPPWDDDRRVAATLGDRLGLPVVKPGLVLEGGAIEGNGAGTILTTDSCLTCPNRNPGATRLSLEQALSETLQSSHVIWLPGGGIVGDDTDGHIDQSARFVDAATVVSAAPWAPDAPEADALRANREALESAALADGRPLRIIDLPLPTPKFQQDARLPASYCNFLLVNGGVIVPTFRDAADDGALRILHDCFPDRTVLGVDATDLVWGLGAFHCLTQQQPAALNP